MADFNQKTLYLRVCSAAIVSLVAGDAILDEINVNSGSKVTRPNTIDCLTT